ncbi:hypothetical protein BsWGS_13517 [Bradybaena similaris]
MNGSAVKTPLLSGQLVERTLGALTGWGISGAQDPQSSECSQDRQSEAKVCVSKRLRRRLERKAVGWSTHFID